MSHRSTRLLRMPRGQRRMMRTRVPSDALGGSYAMAGSDPADTAWAHAYDDAVTTTLGASQDVVNGCFRLAAY